MVRAKVFVEGGGDSKDLRKRCNEGFSKLLEKAGFRGRMPRLTACGGRGEAYDSFCTEVRQGCFDWVALWVDSEEPMRDLNAAWAHLAGRDGWNRPHGVTDDQVLLMVTCMESWIAADRDTLREHFHGELLEGKLPSLVDLEARNRHQVQAALVAATAGCTNRYAKGARSFEVLGKLAPDALRQRCASFARCERILNEKLG